MKNQSNQAIAALLMVVTLLFAGCNPVSRGDSGNGSVGAGGNEEQEQSNTRATGFASDDFIAGDEVLFSPGETDQPAIISFFSPG